MFHHTSVEIFRDNSELPQIRAIWESWHTHPNIDIDFYQTILRERSEILRPHVMLARREGCPQAMLVGRIERRHLAIKIGYLTLFQPNVRLLTLPFGGLLGRASDESCRALVREVINSLRRGEADLALFEPVPTESPLYHCVQTSPAWFCKDYLHTSQIHRSMAVPDSVESFYASLSPKVRKNLKWQAKKLLNDFSGEVRIACYCSPADLEVMIKDVESVAQKTYQRGLGVGFSNKSETRARLKLEAEMGWLRGYVLYLADKPCAFWLGTAYQRTFHSNFMGYDPAYANNSPGMFLVTKVLEGLCKQNGTGRPTQVDFGLGDAQYKKVLGTTSWEESGLYIFAPSLKGFTLNFLATSLGSLDRFARKLLDRTNLLGRIKNLWRKSARRTAAPHSGKEGSG
jgi:hypothetical protein